MNSMKNNQYDLATLRHSAAHLAAQAVTELFPGTKLTIGPATDDGFFYDILPERNLKEEDLAAIHARMQELADQKIPLVHTEVPKDEARKLYKDNPFKLEIIDQIPGDTAGIATQSSFFDLCRGGHVAHTGYLKHTILLGLSGSYWRGNRDGQALQRITGTAFFTAEDLQAYLQKKEDALKYDHRRIGKQLDLFSFHEEGVGFPFYHPKGAWIFNKLVSYMRELHQRYQYDEIRTPTMLSDELWRRSGHYAHYKDNMYFCTIDESSYAIKPMNCPGSILVYQSRPRSYRELPLKLAEFGHVHRHELSGVLHGLMRVRAFTQDDAHIYCTPEQIEAQVTLLIKIIAHIFKAFGFTNVRYAISTKPEKAMGSDELWDIATKALTSALTKAGLPFGVKEGDGAFYGPKIDVVLEDSMERSWQCSTVQLDFFQPQNFDLHYVAPSGEKQRPVIIHQAIYGSLERFMAILLEHHKGNLPFWLSPVQAHVMTITDKQQPYAQQVTSALKKAGIRAALITSNDPVQAHIKTAQEERIPWMIVIGPKEEAAQTVALRSREGKQEFGLTVAQLVERAAQQTPTIDE
jgi:threonyl-tRNA synthetase